MTDTATPSGRGESGLAWLAGGLAVLPLLQAVPWDFDFSAPLVVGAPALWFGRETVRRAVERLLGRIRRPGDSVPTRVLVDPVLLPGDSVGEVVV